MRLNQLQQWLKTEQHDLAFIHSTENVFYLTGFYCEPHERLMGVFVFPEDAPFLVCPKMEVSHVKQSGWEAEIIGYEDHENPWDKIATAFQVRKLSEQQSLAIEKDTIPYARVEAFLQVIPKAQFVSVESILNQARLIKDEAEITILRRAATMADRGVEIGIGALQEGKTELEVIAEIEYELKKQGIRQMSFSTLVLFGEKTAQPHGIPGERRLRKGDLVLFDLGVVLDGYCSDITRTVVFNSITEKQREIYNIVLEAQQQALIQCVKDKPMSALDRTARAVIADAGYGSFFTHRLGHGLGIDVHEFPSLHEKSEGILKPGMVFTIEPGVYVPEVGGVRIEDDVFITDNGYELLTRFPKELRIV
ncbi:aminopeptidase P family protein [Hazenella sp. IB182357]|uniref:Aminopeptidase P family protein n=1 Tax=Polycladospora coralii TaxID=2771432 RepID=A0A926N730_9BACL|nr:Xaa-Pro peptidase family protein [Polycladospora coralii]MBD1371106.1 aminopeptidase P family protein [Polycladospora coralii]MBS7530048.1 aminopeptidase P family protein [Polycladospora coralii]